MNSLVSTFHDTAVSPEAWPHALTALTDAAGVALIILNKSTGTWMRPAFPALALDTSPTMSGTTPLVTRTRHCSTEAGRNSPAQRLRLRLFAYRQPGDGADAERKGAGFGGAKHGRTDPEEIQGNP
jgi:hypothetical protein